MTCAAGCATSARRSSSICRRGSISRGAATRRSGFIPELAELKTQGPQFHRGGKAARARHPPRDHAAGPAQISRGRGARAGGADDDAVFSSDPAARSTTRRSPSAACRAASFRARFHWPQDAAAQLTLAVEQHAAMFGRAPRGLWPSEGSIAPELIPLMQRSGIEYFCSDEENLFNSLKRDPAFRGATVDHLELFQGWRVDSRRRGGERASSAKNRSRISSASWRRRTIRRRPRTHLLHPSAAHRRAGAERHRRDPADPRRRECVGDICRRRRRLSARALRRHRRRTARGCTAARSRIISAHHPPTQTAHARCTPARGSAATSTSGSATTEENRAWDLLGETRAFLKQRIDSGALTPAQQRCGACARSTPPRAATGSGGTARISRRTTMRSSTNSSASICAAFTRSAVSSRPRRSTCRSLARGQASEGAAKG